MKTRVYILYTGGTIGMAPKDPNDPYSPLEPKPLSDLLRFVPGFSVKEAKSYRSDTARQLAKKQQESLQKLERAEQKQAALKEPDPTLQHEIAKLIEHKPNFLELDSGNVIEFGSGSIEPVDSSDISPTQWIQIAQKIRTVYADYDGFIVLHGTDTMAYTSSALSFMFENLDKPVIVTGSQLPIAATRTDAVLNFTNAIYVAGYQATDLPLIPEVVIVFADKVLRGCRATKVSSSDWAGFDSPNFPQLGTIGEHITINTNYLLPRPDGKRFFVKTDLVPQVFNISVFPGLLEGPMRKLFLDGDTEGIVLRTYGTGNVPGNEGFLHMVEQSVQGDALTSMTGDIQPKVIASGRLIVNISQCTQGTVEMGLYEASSGILERGVLSGLDMTPEAALTKLMWTLGTQFGSGRIAQMQISQRGEQTENLFDLRYGAVAAGDPVSVFTASAAPDGRLDRDRISRAMLRLSGLGVKGVEDGERVDVRVFMNMPRADHRTTVDEARCVASISFVHEADKPVQTRMQNITYKTQNVIGSGDVILTLVTSSPQVKLFFKGLYLAVYAKS